MFDDVALPILLTGAAAFVIAWLFVRARAGDERGGPGPATGRRSEWPGALVIAAAAPAVFLSAFGRPFWPPVEASNRVAWLLMVIAAVSLIASAIPRLGALRWAMALAPLGVVYPHAVGAWPVLKAAPIVLIAMAAVVTFSISLRAVERRGHAASAAFILAGMVLAMGAAIAGSGNLSYGKLAWSLALPAIALTSVLAFRRGAVAGATAYTAAAAVLVSLLTAAWCYTSDLLPRTTIALPLLPFCPALALAADTALCRKLGSRAATAVRIAAAAVPAAILLALAVDVTGARS